MNSILSAADQLIDCRKLILSGSFFALSPEQTDELTSLYFQFFSDRFGEECVLDWRFQNHACRDISAALQKYKLKNGAYQLMMQGNVICNSVYNKKTFRAYIREVEYPRFPRERIGEDASIDYESYYQAHIRNCFGNPEILKSAILDLFNLEGKIHLGESQQPDLFGHLAVFPVGHTKEQLFCGEFRFSVPIFCLGEELDAIAEEFLTFGVELCSRFDNTNVQIQLNADEGIYSSYFGQFHSNDCSAENVMFRHYARQFYLPEIGWANIICKNSSQLGIDMPSETARTNLTVKPIAGGGTMVRVNRPISKASIADLKNVKRVIYHMVLPRSNTLQLEDWHPRCKWEVVPIFPEELTVSDCCITLRHFGSIDSNIIRSVLR